MEQQDYAGKYLYRYEGLRYSFREWISKYTVDPIRRIVVEPDAEQFADVSFYQAVMNWSTYQANARAGIIRLGQNVWVDTEFEYNYAQARQQGVALGGYWFYDDRVSPEQQANIIIQLMHNKYFELELFIDWEVGYGGNYPGLKNAVLLMQILDGAGLHIKASGLYTGYYYFTEHSNASVNVAEYAYLKDKPLWLAWYAAASLVKVPLPWTTWTHWQFGTPTINWGQATARIDMDKANATQAEFETIYLGGVTPPPTGGTMLYGKVNTAALNIRTTNAATGMDIGDLVAADYIIATETLNGWWKLKEAYRGGWTGAPVALANGVLVNSNTGPMWCKDAYVVVVPAPPVTPPPTPGGVAKIEILPAPGTIIRELDVAGNVLSTKTVT